MTEHSWLVPVAQVAENNYNLDIRNPSQEALVHRPPEELVESILDKEHRFVQIDKIKQVLAEMA